MSNASLDGKSISIEDAYRRAAQILAGAKFPLIAGLGADVAGARAAILLAERLRGAYDHLASGDSLADIDTIRSFGMFTTTPNEARVRADVVLLIGPGLAGHWPGLFERLALDKPPRHGANAGKPRKIVWLGPKRGEGKIDGGEVKTIAAAPHEISGVLAAWRARLGGRPVALEPAKVKATDALVSTLKEARFGVAVWAAGAGLDALAVEMLQGLVTELNATTRFTGVPLGARSGAAGVNQTSGWMTGFPPRTGFGRGYPEHDPWRFEAGRLVESGEAAAALWISAYDGEPPPWGEADIPTITLAPAGAAPERGLYIEVGRPGRDHDAVEFAPEAGGLALRPAAAPSLRPSVASVIAAIGAKFPEDSPC
jgi:formylmethanofuran dehydrogenase subunit B